MNFANLSGRSDIEPAKQDRHVNEASEAAGCSSEGTRALVGLIAMLLALVDVRRVFRHCRPRLKRASHNLSEYHKWLRAEFERSGLVQSTIFTLPKEAVETFQGLALHCTALHSRILVDVRLQPW